MAYKINGTTVVDNSRNVCACCITSCCITASTRMDAPSGTTAQRPSSPATGSLYFDTDEGSLLSYDGTDWAAVGGAGGVTPLELNEHLTDSCDANGLLFISATCCVNNTGQYCCNKCYNCACSTSVMFNYKDSYSAVNNDCLSGSGKTYMPWTPYYGSAPCQSGFIINSNNVNVSDFCVCLTCSDYYGVCNTKSNYMFNAINGCGFNCFGQHCGTPSSASVRLHGGYGGASFSHSSSNLDCRYCGAAATALIDFNEHFINTKGGMSFRCGNAKIQTAATCSNQCFGLNEHFGPTYFHDGPWGPIPNVVGALTCYGDGSTMDRAFFTTKESSFGNSALEVCDFAYHQACFQETGCDRWYGCSGLKYPYSIPNAMLAIGTLCCQKITLAGTFAHDCGFCYPYQKFSLISKKVGFNIFCPASYTCCVSSSTDSKGVTKYTTENNACGAWLVGFQPYPWCTTTFCACSCQVVPILSKDKCCIDFLVSMQAPCCNCFCCIIDYVFQCCANTNCNCRLACQTVELHSFNIGTGVKTFCGSSCGKCNRWIFETCICCCNLTEACVRKNGQSATEVFACAIKCSYDWEQSMPKAFGVSIAGSPGIWSCNSCKMYFVERLGITVWDGSAKKMACKISCPYQALCCFTSDCMVQKLYKCNMWYCVGSCDTCYCAVWSKSCLLSHYCGCLCTPFQTMGLSTQAAWNNCCNMLFDPPVFNDGFCWGHVDWDKGSVYMYVNPVTDHLVMLGRMYTTQGNPACRQIAWEGFLCYDMENKCLSKVHTLFPDLKSRINTYGNSGNTDNRYAMYEGGTANYLNTSCVCAGSSYVAKTYLTPDCCTHGYQFAFYHGPCHDATAEVRYGRGIAFTKQSNCCNSVFGCDCLGGCLLCCAGKWYSAAGFFRVPMDKPFECVGIENDCDMLKLFGAAFNQGEWACHVWRCCTNFCWNCAENVNCKWWSGGSGGTTGFNGTCTGFRYNPCKTVNIHDADTTRVCMCCLRGVNTSGCVTEMCCICHGCCRWVESAMYKGIKTSTFPNSNPMATVIDNSSVWSVACCDLKDVVVSAYGPVTYPMIPACGDTSFTNRICRFFKEKVVCIC